MMARLLLEAIDPEIDPKWNIYDNYIIGFISLINIFTDILYRYNTENPNLLEQSAFQIFIEAAFNIIQIELVNISFFSLVM